MRRAVLVLTIVNFALLGFLLYFTGSVTVSILNGNDNGWGTLAMAVISLYAFFGSLILCVPMIIFVRKLTLSKTKLYFYSSMGNVLLTVIMFIVALALS